MTFDAEAYAEGICNSSAASESIETLVDTLDSAIIELTNIEGDEISEVMASLTGDPQPAGIAAQLQELREAIAARSGLRS